MSRPSTWKTSHLSPGRAVRAPWRRFWRLHWVSWVITCALRAYQDPRHWDWEASPGLACVSVHWGFLQPGGSGSAGGRRGAGKCRSVSFPVCTVSCGQPRQHRAYPGESPTRSFLPGIHYTRRRIMFLLLSWYWSMAKNLIYMSVFNKLKRLFDIREHFLLDCIVITIHIKYKQRLLRLTLS